jgi:transposase-like protein
MSSQNDIAQEGKLLSAQERVAFRMIATGNDLHGKRAIALLAIDDGVTQAEAAQQAGLTPGQVKYWLDKFRQVRMQIFPEEVLKDQEPEAAAKAGKSKAKKNKKKSGKESKTKQGKNSKKKKGAGKKKKGKCKDKDKKAAEK